MVKLLQVSIHLNTLIPIWLCRPIFN